MADSREQHFKRRKTRAFRRKLMAVACVVLIAVGIVFVYRFSGVINVVPVKVVLVTSMGNITIQLYSDMLITSGNFENLTKNGVYDGTIFHRVVKDFVVQGGDVSGKGITVRSIVDELPNKHNNVRGSVAMAKLSDSSGAAVANSATSQFYINLNDTNTRLDSDYSVFGTVVDGMDVVDAIGNVDVDSNDKPKTNVTLTRALILG